MAAAYNVLQSTYTDNSHDLERDLGDLPEEWIKLLEHKGKIYLNYFGPEIQDNNVTVVGHGLVTPTSVTYPVSCRHHTLQLL